MEWFGIGQLSRLFGLMHRIIYGLYKKKKHGLLGLDDKEWLFPIPKLFCLHNFFLQIWLVFWDKICVSLEKKLFLKGKPSDKLYWLFDKLVTLFTSNWIIEVGSSSTQTKRKAFLWHSLSWLSHNLEPTNKYAFQKKSHQVEEMFLCFAVFYNHLVLLCLAVF